MANERHSTAIHEAGHAVVSFMVGRRILYAVMINDDCGEVVPLCSVCDTCLAYYSSSNPANDAHSKQIQDDLRCDMAIAMAGEFTQRSLCGNQGVDEADFAKDRSRAGELASAIHLWKDDAVCWQYKYSACQICSTYRQLMTLTVSNMVASKDVKDCVKALGEVFENTPNSERIGGTRIEDWLKGRGLTKGSEISSLPSVPEANCG